MNTLPRTHARTPEFHALRISHMRTDEADAILLAFDVPSHLAHAYAFEAGQHLTLRARIDGEELRRAYSICAPAPNGALEVCIRRIDGGRFSNWAMENLASGDALDVMTPIGHFTLPPPAETPAHYVFFAAGSGVTPILSLVSTLLEREPSAAATLLYVNRSAQTTLFSEELMALKNRHPHRLALWFHYTRENADLELFSGRLTKNRIAALVEEGLLARDADAFYLCGPQDLVDTAMAALSEAGVTPARVHRELFGLAHPPPKPQGAGAGEASLRVRFQGRATPAAARSGENLLEAAARARDGLPYACKAGVCSTCRAKVTSGSVEMAANYALTPEEVAQGFILACQSYAASSEVELDFDA
ncbi:MAG: 2Fe-2S iron-sulfur cluster-binding protein [Hyphomonadaceae bacterium]